MPSALARHHRLLATALEATSQPTLITDRDGSIVWANTALLALTGYSTDEIKGQNPRIFKSGQFDAAYYRRMWDALIAGKTWSDEFVNRRKDGSLYHSFETITPVGSESGEITHFVASVVDRSQEKTWEEEIARLNRLYVTLSKVNQAALHVRTQSELFESVCRAIVEGGGFASAWIGVHEPRTNTIVPVAHADAETGERKPHEVPLDPGEGQNQPAAAAVVREGRPVVIDNAGQNRPTQGDARPEPDQVRHSCAIFPLQSEGRVCAVLNVYAARPSEFAAKEIALLTEVAADASFAMDRLTAETRREQLETSYRRLATIVEASDDAIVSRTSDGTILTWNSGAEKIYGYSAAEMIGRSQSILIPADRADEIAAIDARLQNGETVPTFDTIRRRKDGREIQVAVTVSALEDEQGKVIGAATIARDVTEQRKLAEQFLRTQRLESVGELASGVAHDLNNVLSPIRLGIPVMRFVDTTSEIQGLLDVMEASVSRGAQVVRQILNFARGTSGTKVPLQTRHLVRELAEMIEQMFPKSIQVRADFSRDLWPVLVDSTQLHQVFLNLCLNARDAMAQGGELTLSGKNVEVGPEDAEGVPDAKAGKYVLWTVTDTGTGISRENLDRIFKPFFTTKEPGKGTGLGLSTVHQIVRDHGGFLQVESQVGRGSQFRVYLPAVEFESPTPGSAHPLLPTGRGELVLVVDDEYSVRLVIEQVLQRNGYQVLSASGGAHAQQLFRGHTPKVSVLITDIAMPGMDGSELIRLMRALDPDLKVIAMSGVIERTESGASEIDVIADAFLAKPFSMDVLLITLSRLLAPSR